MALRLNSNLKNKLILLCISILCSSKSAAFVSFKNLCSFLNFSTTIKQIKKKLEIKK